MFRNTREQKPTTHAEAIPKEKECPAQVPFLGLRKLKENHPGKGSLKSKQYLWSTLPLKKKWPFAKKNRDHPHIRKFDRSPSCLRELWRISPCPSALGRPRCGPRWRGAWRRRLRIWEQRKWQCCAAPKLGDGFAWMFCLFSRL